MENKNYALGLDVSTSCIGIALFEDYNTHYKLKMLHHVAPKVKPKPESKTEELFKKVDIFQTEFLNNYKDLGIKTVVIEEPLMSSNNIFTVATLLKFNGMISKAVYDTLGVVPVFISSYDSRKYAFQELMDKRRFKKDGTPIPQKQIDKNEPVLFGGYPFDVDKKQVILEKVSELEPQIVWLTDKKNNFKKENFDSSDAYCVLRAFFNIRKNKIEI